MSTAMTERSRRRITVEDYYHMAEVGLIKPDARVELIEGEIIEMAPMGSPHGGTLTELMHLFMRALEGTAGQLRVQTPIRLDNYSEPEPDLAVVVRRDGYYKKSHPGPREVLLLVEIGDSLANFDQRVKVPLYARHRIPEVWTVDLIHEKVHFFRSPRQSEYENVSVTATPGTTTLAALPEVALDLTTLFAS